jgi:hypothetical protein
MKKHIIAIFLVLYACAPVYATRAINFSDVDLDEIKYENRIVLSSEKDDFDFLAETSFDVNQNGVEDFCETNTFYSQEPSATLYIGNAHTRYELSNALLWIGVTGTFQSFSINDMVVSYQDALPASHEAVVWPHLSIRDYVDSVLLIDLESPIAPRLSAADPIRSCEVLSVTFDSLVTDDPFCSIYVGGYGAIKSGFNSVTPSASDFLWKPIYNTVAPEPSSLILFSIGGIGFLAKRKHNKKGEYQWAQKNL